MPREISDEDWNYYQGRKQVADFVESIYGDPALNKEAKALIKKKYPNLQIADYDLEQKFETRLDAEKKAREDAEAATKQAAEDAAWRKKRSEVQKEYGFTDEAMKDLEDFMVKENVGSYEVAATYKATKDPKASEVTYSDHMWNHTKQEGFKEIAQDPEGWAHSEILKAIRADEQRNRGQR